MNSDNWQEELPVAKCDSCGGEVYASELVHFIDGFVICAECFEDYAYEYFKTDMVLGEDLKEMLCTYDDDRAG